MYVLHEPNVNARTYIEEKNYQLLEIRTYCGTYVPLPIPSTRVPTDERTHLTHIPLFLLVRGRTHRTYSFH